MRHIFIHTKNSNKNLMNYHSYRVYRVYIHIHSFGIGHKVTKEKVGDLMVNSTRQQHSAIVRIPSVLWTPRTIEFHSSQP